MSQVSLLNKFNNYRAKLSVIKPSDIIRQSVIYQDILQERLEQKAQVIAINMLNEGIAIAFH
jgi:hypothetical protein